jgi:hypothetical protein
MIFKSQLRRQAIANFVLMWVPDVIIAAVISSYFDGGLFGFILAIAGLSAFAVVYWILQSIVQWVAFLLIGRRVGQRHMYDYLITNQYPVPKNYEPSAADYFISVMENKELNPDLRIKAAVEVGIFAAYSGALDIQRLSKISMAAEGAIKDYRVWLVNEKMS